MQFETLSSQYLTNHPYFRARQDSYRLPSGKIVDPYFVVELPPCVVCMAITQEGDVLLIKQYRHSIGRELLELPGGFIDPNEAPEPAARRELKEETGFEFGEMIYLGETSGNPGLLANITHMFLARDGRKTGDQALDANEEIDVLQVPLHRVKQMLEQNEILQSMHAVCLYKGLQHLGLFA